MNEGIKLCGRLEIFERKCGETEWKKIRDVKNLITNIGFTVIANRLTGKGSYSNVYFDYFAISNGTQTPALTDTATDFYNDGTAHFTKAIQSYDAFSTSSKTQTWNCFLASTDNTVSSITKFALMDDNPGAHMFNVVKFDAISKDTTKEIFFRYSLTLQQ